MTGIISYILIFFVLNVILNAVIRFNPLLGYMLYAGLIFYWFRSIRLRMPKSRPGNYTYQEPINPTPRSNGDVIDVEFTEREDKSGN